jgi:predicted aspartyl protease
MTKEIPYQLELADGSIKKEFVFEAKVVFDGETIPVDVLLSASSDENLAGTALLQNQSLMIDSQSQLPWLHL